MFSSRIRVLGVFGVACVLLSAVAVQASPLAIGQTQFPAIGEPDPTGGVAACPTISFPYATATFSGTLTTSVLIGDPSNPFPGGLTFTYILHNDATSSNTNARLTTRDWTGFATDASYQIPLSGIAPAYYDRITADVVGFSFAAPPLGAGSIGPGASSDLLVVQTNATQCVPAIANVIDGAVATVNTWGPAPEPASLAFLALGGLALIRRRR